MVANISDAIWLVGTLAVWFGVCIIARKAEFNVQFRSQLFSLSPSDLTDEAYEDILHRIVPWRSVRNSRRHYTGASLLIVVILSGLVACTGFRRLAQQFLPPVIFTNIEDAGSSRYEQVFMWSVFFGVALHLVPILTALVSRKNPQAAAAQPNHTNPVLETLDRLFAFQQFLLQRYLSDLLQYRTSADEASGSGRRSSRGTVAQMAKQQIAIAMDRDGVDAEPLYRTLVDAGDAKPLRSVPVPDNLHKLLVAIDARGIPATRAAVGWRTERRGRRRIVSIDAVGRVDSTELGGWMVNIGTTADSEMFSSFLFKFPDPKRITALTVELEQLDRLQLLSLSDQGLHSPVSCRIIRADWANGDLYVAGVVQDGRDLSRYSGTVRKILKASHWRLRSRGVPRLVRRA